LRTKLEAVGFRVIFFEYFNRAGILGWFLNGKILRRKRLSSSQLSVYNFLVPLFRLEALFPLPFGTSLLAVGEKPK